VCQRSVVEERHYPRTTMDDYWNDIRAWDVLADIAAGGGVPGGDDLGPGLIPDQFGSARQYAHVWASHSMRETRAQLLSEILSNTSLNRVRRAKGGNNGLAPVVGIKSHMVSAKPMGENGRGNGRGNGHKGGSRQNRNGSEEGLLVQLRPVSKGVGQGERGAPWFANDFVLLVPCLTDVADAFQKNKKASGNRGKNGGEEKEGGATAGRKRTCPATTTPLALVGHVEQTRQSTDGLNVRVSRTLWMEVVSGESSRRAKGQDPHTAATASGAASVGHVLFNLLHLGSNVTSMREFSALARIERIPLLGGLLDGRGGDVARAQFSTEEVAGKEAMIKNMGGEGALGKGFVKFASTKFNPSQLGAISVAAQDYGRGGFTLIKGPPGTGKTTTLCSLLNALHLKQFNKFYVAVSKFASKTDQAILSTTIDDALRYKPRLLVCAPSNTAVDNVIIKIMEDGFVDGAGKRYNPSMVRVGVGQGQIVKDVALESRVKEALADKDNYEEVKNNLKIKQLQLQKIKRAIFQCHSRLVAISKGSKWPLAREWEIRIEENANEVTLGEFRVYYVNHTDKTTTYIHPPPPEPGVKFFKGIDMPDYKKNMSQLIKQVEQYHHTKKSRDKYELLDGCRDKFQLKNQLETNILDSVHVVLTTLGSSGSKCLEECLKFDVVVVDEAAQCIEPSTLVALQLGSSHAILVGDPQQLPATIFSVSGRNTKFDRSLFQRLEDAGHPVHMLDTQYRMHPAISEFPRKIFYEGMLKDGPNVTNENYGSSLRRNISQRFPPFKSFTILDLESSEERGGTSLQNSSEANLALHLYNNLVLASKGALKNERVAVITPYTQQKNLLRRIFEKKLGPQFASLVEVNTVDSFQGREAGIVIFSCVRAAGSRGIGFLSDVRRMNVALTRAKYYMFVIAHCKSISVNPYWEELVKNSAAAGAVLKIPPREGSAPNYSRLRPTHVPRRPLVSVHKKKEETSIQSDEEGEIL